MRAVTLSPHRSPQPLRLNCGCGSDLLDGWINVDKFQIGDATVMDLEALPWPFEDDSVDEVLMKHVLEHLRDTVGILREVYRVCRAGARVHIIVPHPRHDDYISDPTHVSPITLNLLSLFSKRECIRWREMGASNTPMALLHNVDFEIVEHAYNVDEFWERIKREQKWGDDELHAAIRTHNNVVKEIDVTMVVRK